VVLMATFWVVVFQGVRGEVGAWTLGEFLFWFALSLVSLVVSCLLVRRSKRLERAVRALAERLTVFLYLYVPLGVVGLVVVVARNVLGAG